MKLSPESELKKYSKMLEYWEQNPKGHETTIKHLKLKINYIECQIRNKHVYKRYKRKLDYLNKKANEAR